jgi:hypothetical protein
MTIFQRNKYLNHIISHWIRLKQIQCKEIKNSILNVALAKINTQNLKEMLFFSFQVLNKIQKIKLWKHLNLKQLFKNSNQIKKEHYKV